jgi:signal peptidase II
VSAPAPWARVGLVAVLVLAADQISKALIVASIGLGERRGVIPGLLSLVHAQNSGVAFSLLSGSELIVVLVTLVIIGAVVAFFAGHAGTRLLWLATGLIVGGALGNLLDRIRAGSVTDFIQLPHWPAFNLADTSITLGVATLIVILGRGGAAARPA